PRHLRRLGAARHGRRRLGQVGRGQLARPVGRPVQRPLPRPLPALGRRRLLPPGVLGRRGGSRYSRRLRPHARPCPASPMKLYQTCPSPFPTRVRLCLYAKGLSPEIIEPPGFHATRESKGDYFAVNPLGRVPALITDDGHALPESEVICEYLEDA